MKAILEFTLPGDEQEHRDAIDAWKYKKMLADIDNRMRNIMKYLDFPANYKQCAQDLREELWAGLNDLGVTIDD